MLRTPFESEDGLKVRKKMINPYLEELGPVRERVWKKKPDSDFWEGTRAGTT